MQDRGNVALPVDIVKVLKSQDANYIRTMRTTNAKVGSLYDRLHVRSQAERAFIDRKLID